MTIANWEKGRTRPSIRQLPRILAFLGYVPFDCPSDPLRRLQYYRLIHGLSSRALACDLNIDESLVRGWLAGKHRPGRKSLERIEAFLRAKGLPDPPSKQASGSQTTSPVVRDRSSDSRLLPTVHEP